MFYDKFIQLCEIHNEKPTPLLNNLEKLNIFQSDLVQAGLPEKKISDLYNRNKPSDTIIGLTASDLALIAHTFDVSYDFMFACKHK